MTENRAVRMRQLKTHASIGTGRPQDRIRVNIPGASGRHSIIHF